MSGERSLACLWSWVLVWEHLEDARSGPPPQYGPKTNQNPVSTLRGAWESTLLPDMHPTPQASQGPFPRHAPNSAYMHPTPQTCAQSRTHASNRFPYMHPTPHTCTQLLWRTRTLAHQAANALCPVSGHLTRSQTSLSVAATFIKRRGGPAWEAYWGPGISPWPLSLP